MARNQALFDAITQGRRREVIEIVQSAIERGEDLGALLDETMIPAMRETGERFSRGELYVPDMLVAARAMQAGLSLLEPVMTEGQRRSRGKVVIGTVQGDLHDIGKNLVAMMLRGAGFEVLDLGVNCSLEKFDKAVEDGFRIVCLSALLTTTMPFMGQAVEHFAGRNDVQIVVGGAPVSAEFAKRIGADGYGKDASEAVPVVEACARVVYPELLR
ncbi:MAG TPA: corrinoid protein [Acidobacteriota bacterium]|mgnify:CR=1 FL=1|nr:corrinoid protein [Acidobacteriota bacterium]